MANVFQSVNVLKLKCIGPIEQQTLFHSFIASQDMSCIYMGRLDALVVLHFLSLQAQGFFCAMNISCFSKTQLCRKRKLKSKCVFLLHIILHVCISAACLMHVSIRLCKHPLHSVELQVPLGLAQQCINQYNYQS